MGLDRKNLGLKHVCDLGRFGENVQGATVKAWQGQFVGLSASCSHFQGLWGECVLYFASWYFQSG